MKYLFSAGMGVLIGLQSVGLSRVIDKQNYDNKNPSIIGGKTSFCIVGALGSLVQLSSLRNFDELPAASVVYATGLVAGRIAGNIIFDYVNPDFDDYRLSNIP